MSEVVNIGRWNLKCDREETRAAYLRVPFGSPESCGCEDCLNLAAARSQAYPPKALEIFEQLGIDCSKEAETWRMYRDESGLHHYSGFFHFIGSIESGKDVMQVVNEIGTYDFEETADCFKYGFTSDAQLLPESFTGKEVVQLEFQTKATWVIDAKESD